MEPLSLDDPRREAEIIATIKKKPGLRDFYVDAYQRFAAELARTGATGAVLELGAGGGFLREHVPDVISSDVLPYRSVDVVLDARRLPVRDGALRAVFMMNVLHHVPDVEALLAELVRCVAPGGCVWMREPYPGVPGAFVARFLHHEPYDPRAPDWRFPPGGPLSSANQALPWIVFERDRARFEARFPALRVHALRTHSALRYWLSGGLRPWSLTPTAGLARAAERCDAALSWVSPRFASFVDIEIRRD